jgi:hypothetical protein
MRRSFEELRELLLRRECRTFPRGNDASIIKVIVLSEGSIFPKVT